MQTHLNPHGDHELWRAWYTADPPMYGYDSLTAADGVLGLIVTRARFHDPVWDVPSAKRHASDPTLQRVWRRRPASQHLYVAYDLQWSYNISGWRRRLALWGFWFDWESAERHGEGLAPPPTGFGLNFGVPFWFLSAVLALLPAKAAMQMYRIQRRIKLGLCGNCGYDLRASPEQCPECGRPHTPNVKKARC